MTFRHAAALALVGWYLMMPPWGKGIQDALAPKPMYGTTVDTSAPLVRWTVLDTFDTASDCQKTKKTYSSLQSDKRLGKMVDEMARKESTDATYEQRETGIKLLRKRVNEMQCVSSDDPRLKGK